MAKLKRASSIVNWDILDDFFDEDIKKTTFSKEINEDGKIRLEEVIDKKTINALLKFVKKDSIFEN